MSAQTDEQETRLDGALAHEVSNDEKLKAAFSHMMPDAPTRARMLDAILAEYAETQQDLPPQQDPKQASAQKKPARFSPIRYILPIAACLILALAMPLALPRIMASVTEASYSQAPDTGSSTPVTQTDKYGTATTDTTEDASSSTTASPSDQNAAGTEGTEGTTGSLPSSTVIESESTPNAVPSVGVSNASAPLSALSESPYERYGAIAWAVSIGLCVPALVLIILGVRKWRRQQRLQEQPPSTEVHDRAYLIDHIDDRLKR
ncbi:MAG: hypothetical protein FWD72_01040 [Eggerthellaceae bacterium]|nr:hypothetical protein [Eggerthellaceae bacterium]